MKTHTYSVNFKSSTTQKVVFATLNKGKAFDWVANPYNRIKLKIHIPVGSCGQLQIIDNATKEILKKVVVQGFNCQARHPKSALHKINKQIGVVVKKMLRYNQNVYELLTYLTEHTGVYTTLENFNTAGGIIKYKAAKAKIPPLMRKVYECQDKLQKLLECRQEIYKLIPQFLLD